MMRLFWKQQLLLPPHLHTFTKREARSIKLVAISSRQQRLLIGLAVMMRGYKFPSLWPRQKRNSPRLEHDKKGRWADYILQPRSFPYARAPKQQQCELEEREAQRKEKSALFSLWCALKVLLLSLMRRRVSRRQIINLKTRTLAAPQTHFLSARAVLWMHAHAAQKRLQQVSVISPFFFSFVIACTKYPRDKMQEWDRLSNLSLRTE